MKLTAALLRGLSLYHNKQLKKFKTQYNENNLRNNAC